MKQQESKIIYTPSEVLEIIKSKADLIISDNALKDNFIVVEGILGEIKNQNYQGFYYGVPLRDVSGNANTIPLNIPKRPSVLAFQNKEVIAYGFLKTRIWQGNLSFYIEVSRLQPKAKISEEMQEQERLLSEFLRTHKRETRLFPDKSAYTISVIHSISGKVKPDFDNQLGDLKNVSLEYFPVNILSIDDIIKAISEAKGDILVIVRGGGSDGEFEVFNDFKLLEAWVNKKAYKICAVGHSEHRTYLDVYSDISCDTPTAAGAYIKKQLEMLDTIRSYKELSEKHKKDIDDIHKKLTEEWAKQIEKVRKEKDEQIMQFNKDMLITKRNMWIAVGVAVLAVLGLLFGRLM